MKISESSLGLQATSFRASRIEVTESLSAWGSQGAAVERGGRALPEVRVSEAAREALQADESAAAGAAAEDAPLDPKLELVKAIVEMFTGRSIRVLSSMDIQADVAAEVPEGQGSRPPTFGFEYSRSETVERYEAASFEAAGRVRTADGRELSFSLSLSMERYESETRSFRLQAGSAPAKDPLVVNFAADAASLRSQRFSFDLLGNGQEVDMPLLGEGSGFLVLDALDGGRVESGKQLFGPASGDGFADLAAYDSDANGWIDEADPVFGRLGVWTPDATGGGAVRSLAAAGVGALGLDRVATPFALKDGAELGAVRSSGVYLREAGGAGTLQQVDVVV
ncbi:MAG: hypothetical protein PHW25_10330 [Zoogloea sp.]|uniref:hypothetical protein n=1 Tax=Zoogloea sp. TaxID=49181 RepID=UPI002612F573|nr:hypothetical protein [Zoogloea sp.]MDD3327466.1 hypothetical protein [Zoogloea sp.]